MPMPGLMEAFRNPTSAESWGSAAVDIALIGVSVAKFGQASRFANAGRIGEEAAAFGRAGRAAERAATTERFFVASEGVKNISPAWPSATAGRHIINSIEYTTHALERMAPKGLIQKGTDMVSRGVPPSVVENAIKFGVKSPGNSASEIVHIFENVRVVTNPETTRVITVITTGK